VRGKAFEPAGAHHLAVGCWLLVVVCWLLVVLSESLSDLSSEFVTYSASSWKVFDFPRGAGGERKRSADMRMEREEHPTSSESDELIRIFFSSIQTAKLNATLERPK
jgi:hypothetical protein